MTNPVAGSRLEPKFNSFLFAAIGEDRHGMPLSVLSALARRDIDPWEEAAALANLSAEAATERLASLISPPQDGPSALLDPATIAARLVVLLPSHTSSDANGLESGPAFGASSRWWPLAYLGMMLFFIGVQALAGSSRQSPQAVGPPVQASTVADTTPVLFRQAPR